MKYLARTSFKMRLILIWQLCLSRVHARARGEGEGCLGLLPENGATTPTQAHTNSDIWLLNVKDHSWMPYAFNRSPPLESSAFNLEETTCTELWTLMNEFLLRSSIFFFCVCVCLWASSKRKCILCMAGLIQEQINYFITYWKCKLFGLIWRAVWKKKDSSNAN